METKSPPVKWIAVLFDGCPVSYRFGIPVDFHPLIVTPELSEMWEEWLLSDSSKDGTLSGVIADWIEENTGEFKNKGLLLKWLRNRFNDPERNQQ